jgi:hypothetical protein
MNEDKLRYGVTIAFGVGAILIALAASLPAPLFAFDKVIVGALLLGGFAAGGVALNLTPSAVKLAREANLNVPIPYAPSAKKATLDDALLLNRVRILEERVFGDVEKPKMARPPDRPVDAEPKAGVAQSETAPAPQTNTGKASPGY